MGRYVAFLRGMNLGRRRVKNDELCACFEGMGFRDVSAVLASGNVLFSSGARMSAAKLEATIEGGLQKQFTYEVRTFVRSAGEVAAIAGLHPFSEGKMAASAGQVQVGILAAAPTAANLKTALALATADDQLCVQGRELYWLPKGNMSASELNLAEVTKALGIMTIRTQGTVKRLASKLQT